MPERHPPDGAADSIDRYLSRDYEDYLDWLENHDLPTDGRAPSPARSSAWGGRCRAYFGPIFVGGIIGAICRLF